MSAVLTNLLADAVETMQDFLRLAGQVPASRLSLDDSHIKLLRERLAAVDEAARQASAEEVAQVRANMLYSEYRTLLARVHEEMAPLRGRLLLRQDQLRRSQSQLESARAFATALARTR
jgi:hypothetical protein